MMTKKVNSSHSQIHLVLLAWCKYTYKFQTLEHKVDKHLMSIFAIQKDNILKLIMYV